MIGARRNPIAVPAEHGWQPIATAPRDRRVWLRIKGYLAIGQWRQIQFAPHLEAGGRWITEDAALNRWLYESGNWPSHAEMAWQELRPPPKRRAKTKGREAIATDPEI